jgi:hypothetical protein
MEQVIRSVRDFKPTERLLLERLVGHHLTDDQQLIIRVVTSPNGQAAQEQLAVSSPWSSPGLGELAAAQGVTQPCSFDAQLGGWPEQDKNDDFEAAVARWRKEDVQREEF